MPPSDHFALLNEPRRPWIDPEALKQKFLSLSSQFHPDRFHSVPDTERIAADKRYSDINAVCGICWNWSLAKSPLTSSVSLPR
jgi:hypothetical protein